MPRGSCRTSGAHWRERRRGCSRGRVLAGRLQVGVHTWLAAVADTQQRAVVGMQVQQSIAEELRSTAGQVEHTIGTAVVVALAGTAAVAGVLAGTAAVVVGL